MQRIKHKHSQSLFQAKGSFNGRGSCGRDRSGSDGGWQGRGGQENGDWSTGLSSSSILERHGLYKQNSLNSQKVNVKFGFLEQFEKDPGLKFRGAAARDKVSQGLYGSIIQPKNS